MKNFFQIYKENKEIWFNFPNAKIAKQFEMDQNDKRIFSQSVYRSRSVQLQKRSQKIKQQYINQKQILSHSFIHPEQEIVCKNISNIQNTILWNKIQEKRKTKQLYLNDLPFSLRKRHFYKESYHGIELEFFQLIYKAKCLDLQLQETKASLQQLIDNFYLSSTSAIFKLSNSSKILCRCLQLHPKILQLILPHNNFYGQSIKNIILAVQKDCPNLLHFDISSNGMDQIDMQYMFSQLQNHPTLISLNASNEFGLHLNRIGKIGCKSLKTYLRNNKILQFLKISTLCIDNKLSNIIFKGLINNQNLISLDISGNEITNIDYLFIQVLVNCAILELNIAQNQIGDTGAQQYKEQKISNYGMLLPGIYNTLQILNISNNRINMTSGDFLSSLAKEKSITTLNFSYNSFYEKDQPNLVKFLSENKYVTHLYLNSCYLKGLPSIYLSKGLRNNSVLIYLNLSENYFGDKSCKILIDSLIKSINLVELVFTHNKMAEQGLIALNALLKKLPRLQIINLSQNYIDNQNIKCILQNLRQKKCKILKFDLSGNFCTDDVIVEINFYLSRHQKYLTKKEIPLLKHQTTLLNQQNKDFQNDVQNDDFDYEGEKQKAKGKIELLKQKIEFMQNLQSPFNVSHNQLKQQLNVMNDQRKIVTIELDSLNKKLNEELQKFQFNKIDITNNIDKAKKQVAKVQNDVNQLKNKMNAKKKQLSNKLNDVLKEEKAIEKQIIGQQSLKEALQKQIQTLTLKQNSKSRDQKKFTKKERNRIIQKQQVNNNNKQNQAI